jgi:hypothetical protein
VYAHAAAQVAVADSIEKDDSWETFGISQPSLIFLVFEDFFFNGSTPL